MNNNIFFFFYNFVHQSAFFDGLIIFFAVYFPFIIAGIAGIFLLFRRQWKNFILVFFSGFLAYFIATILKVLLHTPRPFLALSNANALFNESGFAFPSGHAAFFSALAVSIFFYNKKVGYLFMFFALLIGIARITAGVHFPVDILGGFAFGSLIALFIEYLFKKCYNRKYGK